MWQYATKYETDRQVLFKFKSYWKNQLFKKRNQLSKEKIENLFSVAVLNLLVKDAPHCKEMIVAWDYFNDHNEGLFILQKEMRSMRASILKDSILKVEYLKSLCIIKKYIFQDSLILFVILSWAALLIGTDVLNDAVLNIYEKAISTCKVCNLP